MCSDVLQDQNDLAVVQRVYALVTDADNKSAPVTSKVLDSDDVADVTEQTVQEQAFSSEQVQEQEQEQEQVWTHCPSFHLLRTRHVHRCDL